MSNAVLEDAQRAGDYNESNQGDKTVSIKFSSVITRTSVTAVGSVKSIETNSSKSERLSRVTTRRFTGSHVVKVGDFQSANFAGMDSSAVIPAWSLSSPRIDLLATYLDIHRVARANVLDIAPTDSDLSQRIGNCDSFIEEGHLGADEAQMKEIADQERPTRRGQNSLCAIAEETLSNNSGAENVDSASKEVTTSRTVHLRITHTRSLSRKVLR